MGGVSLGGGMLVALGCRWRFANEHALAGWPEVNLGFCQVHRTHNACRVSLVIVRGVDFITSGVPLPAKHAAQLGSATCGSRRSCCGVKGHCGVCGLQGRPGSGSREAQCINGCACGTGRHCEEAGGGRQVSPRRERATGHHPLYRGCHAFVVLRGRYDGRAEGVPAAHGWRPDQGLAIHVLRRNVCASNSKA